MNRDKHIEEMAKDVCPLIEEYETCEKCDAKLDIGDEPCLYKCMAKAFYNAGYRKASDVAREIFEEIKSIWKEGHGFIDCEDLFKLKKKYTESEKDDG